jgi:hypothetical protein
MIHLRGIALVFGLLVMSASLALTACSTNAATPTANGTIPAVAGTWRGRIDIQDTGLFSGWSGTAYIRVEQTAEGSLSGEAKLCDMPVFGDKAPQYYSITGTADRSNRIKVDIADYHLEGPFDAERLSLMGTVSQGSYAGPNPKSAPATSVFTPVSASEYAAACPRQPTPTPVPKS